ncbi:MAG: 50S ribosomal protein L11 methyltransferase [Candidatus Binataceae bacterium]|nr:50S ribosomal protein L11 methyltransferase [Candidatus Binataceae bacterium]
MAWFQTSETLHEHRGYIEDEPRQGPFMRAIREVVKPGDVVLDIGSGTAVFGILACMAGARRVYAIERGGIIELARKLAAANGCSEKIVFVPGMSTSVELPEPGDVAIADQAGGFGFEAGMIEYFNDARRRLLKPGARTIPGRIESYIAGLEYPEGWERVDFWSRNPAGLNLSAAHQAAANDMHFVDFKANHLLTDPQHIAEFDLSEIIPESTPVSAELRVSRPGMFHGLGGWFVARLSANQHMTNSPLLTERVNRCPIYFPIDRAVPVSEGDQISISMRILLASKVLAWRVAISDSEGSMRARFNHSTFAGELVSREERNQSRPDAIPKRSPHNRAAMLALELIDGKSTIAEIAGAVYAQRREQFASSDEALKLVVEVVRHYGD